MPIINNLAGYGTGSGKTDEFGLPVYEPMTGKLNRFDNEFHQSREAVLEPLTFAFPQGANGFFVISKGSTLQQPLPTANFYDLERAPIQAKWKRGLYVIAPQLGMSGASIMIRKSVPGWKLKFTLADCNCANPVWSQEIDGGEKCGVNQVWEFPTKIADGIYVMWVEVLEAPKEHGCCPLVIATRAVIHDYCHESYADMAIPCDECGVCDGIDVPCGNHPAVKLGK